MHSYTKIERTETLLINNISKLYYTAKGPSVILDDFSLCVGEHEFVSVIGHSGCGKSTVLSMVAGLVPIEGGEILLNGSQITRAGIDRGVVFQNPNLLPWLTALENVMLAVDGAFKNRPKEDRVTIARYYLNKVGLESSANKRITELSQGMKQRVGIARAFALKPKLLLLDEPFGMMDSLTRLELQDILLEIWNEEKITAILVTHDVDESIFMSDRIVMMTKGPAANVGSILEVNLPRPRNRETYMTTEEYQCLREQILDFLEK